MSRRIRVAAVLLLFCCGCGSAPRARVYRTAAACRDAEETSEVRRCVGHLYDDAMVATLGVYPDDDLHAYVRRVGLRVAEHAGRPPSPWTFRVLDEMSAGAWAAPDAHIYVTRGLLAVLANEAELAAVLAHEVGHVVAGHTDVNLERLPSLDAGNWSRDFQLSRDDEAQADQLSVRYLRAAGYDPNAIRTALRTLYRVSDEGGSYSDRHPPLPVRLALTARGADGDVQGRHARARYLRHLEGLVVGRDPRRGRIDGSRFVHDQAGFSVSMPAGFREWEPGAGHGRRFHAEGPDGHLGLSVMHMAGGRGELVDVAIRAGLARPSVRRFEVAGFSAVTGRWEPPESDSLGESRIKRLLFFEARHHEIFALGVSGPASSDAPLGDLFRGLVRSVRSIDGHAVPMRLHIRRFPQDTTLTALGEGCASADQEELIANLNDVTPDEVVEAGRRMKCVEAR